MLGGIGMNNKAEYTPEKVVDISNLSREDWLEYRKKGIGGSDVAAIMGISPFATIRDLFYNKTGVQPVIQEEEESNWVAKEVGHRLEDLVAEIFSKKTGLEVFPVRVMFRHPLYPFMLADVDFLFVCRMGHLRFWNVKPAIIMRKISGLMRVFQLIMCCR